MAFKVLDGGDGEGTVCTWNQTMKWKIVTSLTYQKLLQYKYTPVTQRKQRRGSGGGRLVGEEHFSGDTEPGKLRGLLPQHPFPSRLGPWPFTSANDAPPGASPPTLP